MSGTGHKALHTLGNRDQWLCHWCHTLVVCEACVPGCEAGVRATRDHKIPRAKGGDNSGANKVLACWQCNQAKGDQMWDASDPATFTVSSRMHLTR